MTALYRSSLVVAAVVVVGLAWAPTALAGPQVSGGQLVTTGSDLFKTYCVPCHGADAKGTGPLAAAMQRKPADLTGLTARNKGEFPVEMVAQVIDGRTPVKGHGGGDMPVWGDAFLKSREAGSEAAVKQQIDALVEYLRTLQK